MLPSGETSTASTKGKRAGALKYLTNEMLSAKSQTPARITAVKVDEDNKYGARIILKLAMKGDTIFWGINIKKNPNYKLLTDKLGFEENDWVDQEILLGLDQDSFTGSYFARVDFPEKKKK